MNIYQTQTLGIWILKSETNGFLIVRNGKSILIDCPEYDIKLPELPEPEIILHTQVQEEHCREWQAFPDAKVYVPSGCGEIALRSEKFFDDSRTVWSENRAWDNRGEETYGIAGCLTERPPLKPLNVAGELIPENAFKWYDFGFEIIALPGSGKRSIGLWWKEKNILFSGDMIVKGGYLANLYDIERSYGLPSGYAQLKESMKKILALDLDVVMPSTGQIIESPEADIKKLEKKIEWIFSPPVILSKRKKAQINYKSIREFRRFREIIPGIYQNNNFGNMIVIVDEQGRALVIDPGPCVWLPWKDNCKAVNEDFDSLENEAGLKTVDLMLATHYHGDHVEFCNLLKERYGAKLATVRDVAQILEFPEKYNLPCTLEWYNFPFTSLKSDILLDCDIPFKWNEIEILPVHTPGHCFAHSSFSFGWEGVKLLCVGDTLAYGDGPISCSLPIIYNDTAWPEKGIQRALEKFKSLKPEFILCGHGYSFKDESGHIIDSFRQVANRSYELAKKMIAPGVSLKDAMMTPPEL